MVGSSSEQSGVGRSLEGMTNGQQMSGEALAEWRSSEQVVNGIASTSPPYWDIDDEDDCGPKPFELYGKYTWKIDKFSQINKRELRSNAFEVGGYKWYILIYPQGCDVCNHLSLFLCVANHDKLLPGWSHCAQFTIAVVNKDPKKSKYSDTLHRFWKKEHDWGWKKFMELSKVLDGFVDADTLIIKAQVQVIRERADRPFRCLDCQYRRELVRVYLSNVEQICCRFVEERRGKLGKLIEDRVRWSSFCTFWLGIDLNDRLHMSREKLDSILKGAVKHFFIEKEVASTLVMDSLYSGLKALEGQKARGKCLDTEELPIPLVRVEKDTFILVDDVLLLLERAALDPLPPKDEKGPQNRTKDGGSGEDFSKDSIEHDERRLTELGRNTIEIFVLAQIFSKIEVAYQEAVALRRQEELIREEEAAWMTGIEQKAKRGASENEKKSKKKQGKQKRNNHKLIKDKGREEIPVTAVVDKPQQQDSNDGRKGFLIEDAKLLLQKSDTHVEDVSDVSGLVNCVPEALLQPDSDDRDSSPVKWDTDTSESHLPTEASSSLTAVHNGGRKSPCLMMDDSSSTCSTDSLPSVVMNQPYKGNSLEQNQKSQQLLTRGKDKQQGKTTGHYVTVRCKADELCDVAVISLQECVHDTVKKEEVVSLQKQPSVKDEVVPDALKESTAAMIMMPSPPPLSVYQKTDLKNAGSDPAIDRRPPSEKTMVLSANSAEMYKIDRRPPYAYKIGTQKPTIIQESIPTEKAMNGPGEKLVSRTIEKLQVPSMSRPLGAPVVPWPRHSATPPIVSMVQAAPFLPCSVTAAGRFTSPATHQSYRNAMMRNPAPATSTSQPHSPNLTSCSHSQPPHPSMISATMFLPRNSERLDSNNSPASMFSFGILQNGSQSLQWGGIDPCLLNDIQNIDLHRNHFSNGFTSTGLSGHNAHGMLAEEFPHLDIINDLLDDEYGMHSTAEVSPLFHSFSNGPPHHLSHQFTYPLDQCPCASSCRFERSQSYHEEFQQRSYGGGSFGPQFDLVRQQPNFQPYIHNQWQMGGSDVSSRNMDNDAYQYSDYSSLMTGVNGYTVYQSSNGL